MVYVDIMLYPILVQDVASMPVGCDLARWIKCRFWHYSLAPLCMVVVKYYCMTGKKKESLPWSKGTQEQGRVSTEATYGRLELPRMLVFEYPS